MLNHPQCWPGGLAEVELTFTVVYDDHICLGVHIAVDGQLTAVPESILEQGDRATEQWKGHVHIKKRKGLGTPVAGVEVGPGGLPGAGGPGQSWGT